ncbi:peptidase T [Candidatus Lokiarchaeum ossiferum]|uniref:peptidase T n=1 Tax=Candidatus Lokiarchaeum ossiferum TaxID=2951803 RepID=UPI00352E45C9
MTTKLVERFLKYVKIDTKSQEGVETIPSTKKQFNLANLLVEELKAIGLEDAQVDEHCVVIATLPSNIEEDITSNIPTICFNAHMDTAPAVSGKDVNPIITKYTGDDIILPQDTSLRISVKEIPELKDYIGTDLIHTDGTTLLGADDKAGIAEIMTAIDELVHTPEKKHGTIKIMFTPDEEVGKGADAVDIEKLGAKYAYTIDGGSMGGYETECFNAAGGKINIGGYGVHPGSAYGKMINSLRIIPEVLSIFPNDQAPETTQGFESYYHPDAISGQVDGTTIEFILRNFDSQGLEDQITYIKNEIAKIQKNHPETTISVEIAKSYRNMKEILDLQPIVAQIASEAIERARLEVRKDPIRGGTDGARFSFMGLPTPNIFTGGFNYHSKKEFISILGMEKAVETILNIIDLYVENFQ